MADILSDAATATQGMIPGGGQTASSLTGFGPTPMVQPPPIPRFQPPEQQFGKAGNEFSTVSGRKRADRQALISNTVNLVKAASNFQQDKKDRALSMDIQTLMEASQGRNEAMQILQDPNSTPQQKQEAQNALKINTSKINSITSDNKKVKLLQKAFNVDLFGGGKNEKENKVFMNAMKEFNEKQQKGDTSALNPIAQRLMGSQPVRQQLNPEAQAQAQAIKAGLLPKAGEVLKANVEMYKTFQGAKTAEERNTALLQAADIRAKAESEHAGAIVDAANVRALGQQAAAEIRSRAQIKIAQMNAGTWDKRIAAMTSIADDKNTNEQTKTILGSVSKDITSSVTRLKDIAKDNANLYNVLDKKGSTIIGGIKLDANNPMDAKRIRQYIGRNDAAMKDENNNLNVSRQQLKTLQGMGLISLAGGGGGNSEPGSSQENPEDFDPNEE